MSLAEELLAELEPVFERATEIFQELVKADPAMPVGTGNLRDGIEVEKTGDFTGRLESTATSEDGTDYGQIIDGATGRLIEPVNKQALSNGIGGDFGPVRSARQSTKHAGWWEKAVRQDLWEQALEQARNELM